MIADPGPPAVAEQAFREAVAHTQGPRTGAIFTLPNPYNFVNEADYNVLEPSHIPGRGVIQQRGTYHSTVWLYDRRIPLVFYGPGRVRAGLRPAGAATQQDLPATYAWLLKTLPPQHCAGKPLMEAFLPGVKPPRVVFTIVLDQGGRTLYAAHPGRYPNIARLMAGGTDYVNALTTNLESETGPGHVALGTGSYAAASGIPASDYYAAGLGRSNYTFNDETAHSPFLLEAPALGDIWPRVTGGKAIVAGLAQADRSVIGMIGHGSAFQGNARPIGVFYSSRAGGYETHPAYYHLPAYLGDLNFAPYVTRLTGGSGRWLDHDVSTADAARRSPALAEMEGDAFARVIANEPIGQDDVCDLLYLSFKSSDAVGHRYGFESQEAGETLAAIDTQVGRLVAAVQAKAGAENVLVALTADHGAGPLPELSGGTRLLDGELLARLNKRFPSPYPGRPAALFVTTGQVWLDPQVLKATRTSTRQVAEYLRGLKVNGKPFYRLVIEAAPR